MPNHVLCSSTGRNNGKEITEPVHPIPMAMFGVTTLPLNKRVESKRIVQKWYADDGLVLGNSVDLQDVLDTAVNTGNTAVTKYTVN